MWILDRPSTGPKSPDTLQSIAAFTDFAVAAVRRYRQRGVIFELWNVRSLSPLVAVLLRPGWFDAGCGWAAGAESELR